VVPQGLHGAIRESVWSQCLMRTVMTAPHLWPAYHQGASSPRRGVALTPGRVPLFYDQFSKWRISTPTRLRPALSCQLVPEGCGLLEVPVSNAGPAGKHREFFGRASSPGVLGKKPAGLSGPAKERYRSILTVSLGVTSAVASSCGHDSGQIEQLVAHELAGHWATHEGPAERTQHCHPPHAQPLAPVRQHQGRRPRLTPRGCTDQTPPSDERQPCGRIREEQRHHRSLVPREAMPRR